ncbi:ALKBH3 [Symbiodinium natans]|uniref:ALKBH3 protein n=1 Tax=Symbiodinium natans TaxID=878477 RepID=A0A812R1L5_9DINO|nr:ALKBH3 [Symbiodinium natans]
MSSELPELPISDGAHLKELALWGARTKGGNGLDHGYWQPWGPPFDFQEVARAEKDALGTFAQWMTKQLRSHRDAVARLAAAHVQLQESLSADIVDGKANFASAVAMLTEMPQRMEAAEARTQTLEYRVDRLNGELLNPQPTKACSLPRPAPSISDKPTDEAVKECREAVGLMLTMQQNMKQELSTIEENMNMRLSDFEAALHAAANANHDAVHTLFASRSQELEALYARSAACEEGLQDLQTESSRFAEWKEGASSDLVQLAQRLAEAETDARMIHSGLEELATSIAAKPDPGEAPKAKRAASKLSMASAVGAQAPASDEAVQKAQEAAEKALDVAKQAMLIAEEIRIQVSGTHKAGDVSCVPKPAGSWPCRARVRKGCLPYLPPSSLAHEHKQQVPAAPLDPDRQLIDMLDDQSPSSNEDSYIRDDTDNEPLQRKQDKGQASLAMVLLQGAVEADGSWQKESQDKERFLPPTGGCFRHQSPHSRLGSRNTRPLTAERPRVVHAGGVVRPSTAGHV